MADIKLSRDDLVQGVISDPEFLAAVADRNMAAADIAAAAVDAMLIYVGLTEVIIAVAAEQH